MKESKDKDKMPQQNKKYSKLALVYDEFAIEHVINAIQESYSQAGVSHPEVEK